MQKTCHVRFGVFARIYPVVTLENVELEDVPQEALKALRAGDFELDSWDDIDLTNLCQPAFVAVDVYDSESYTSIEAPEFDQLQGVDVPMYPEDVLEFHAKEMYDLLMRRKIAGEGEWEIAADSLLRQINSEIEKVKEMD